MPRNGSGTYSSPTNSWNPAQDGTPATSVDWQATLDDIEAGISQSISKDGQTAYTGNQPMGGYKLTGLGAGNAAGDSLRFEQLFSQGLAASLAAAATVNIGAQNSTAITVTGTGTITSFGTSYNGPRYVKFEGVCTLTHSSSLVLPYGQNITTVAGQIYTFMPDGNPATGWRLINSADSIPANDSASGTLWTTVQGFINKIISSAGASVVGYQAPGGVPKNIYLRLSGTKKLRDFSIDDDVFCTGSNTPLSDVFATLAAAQVYYPHATSLSDSYDWAVAQKALNYLASIGKPVTLECEDGKAVLNRSLVLNPLLDCSNRVERVTIVAGGSHRAYDSGDDAPFSFFGTGTFDTLFDLRACRKIKVQGVGFYAPSTITRIMRIGAEGCSNAAQMSRVATLENLLMYGGQRNLDVYLVSGLVGNMNNFSRATRRAINLNAVGDSEFTETLVNNTGPILTGGVGSDYYDGAAVLAYGGGGNNRWSGGKIEVVSKGMLLDNVQGWGVFEVTFDKCKEFAYALSGNQSTAGKTANLGYQPRGMRLHGNRFLSNGWDATYRSHLWVANSGTDLEISLTMSGNTFSKGGENAIDLDMDASGIYGAGPYRAIRVNNSASGSNSVHISSSANKFNDCGSTYTLESYSANVTFDSSADEINLPIINGSGTTIGVDKEVTVTIAFTPGTIAAGDRVQSSVTAVTNAGFSTALTATAPSSLLGLVMQAYVTSAGNCVISLSNPTGAPVVGPSGNYVVSYPVKKWLT